MSSNIQKDINNETCVHLLPKGVAVRFLIEVGDQVIIPKRESFVSFTFKTFGFHASVRGDFLASSVEIQVHPANMLTSFGFFKKN